MDTALNFLDGNPLKLLYLFSWPPRCYSYVLTRPYRPEYEGLPYKCCNLGGVSIIACNRPRRSSTERTRHTANKGSNYGRSIEINPVRSFCCYPCVYLPINIEYFIRILPRQNVYPFHITYDIYDLV